MIKILREKKSFFILYTFIAKILYVEDDIFLSLFSDFFTKLTRKINDVGQWTWSYLGNKCLIRDLVIWQMYFETVLVLISIVVDMCINILGDIFEMIMQLPLTWLRYSTVTWRC